MSELYDNIILYDTYLNNIYKNDVNNNRNFKIKRINIISYHFIFRKNFESHRI